MAKDVPSHFIKWKNISIIFLILVIFIIGFTVFNGQETAINSTIATNVAVQKVEEENYAISLDYRGIVQPYETKKYAFLLGGKVEKIYVEKGQKIEPGAILVKLDTKTLELNRSTAAQNVQSLENSVRLSKSYLDAAETLHEQGALAAKELKAKQTEYQNLLISYEMAKNSLSEAAEAIQNATLYSDMTGYVMELPFKEGEIAGAGYPAVIGKSDGIKVTVGVSVDDYAKIARESAVLINGKIKGQIDSIAAFPEEDSMLYAIDVLFDADDIAIGETVDVQIITGTGQGCFVPIESLFSLDGIDYVYTVSEDEAKNMKVNKQQITLHEIKDSSIRVTGLKAGTRVVTAGVKSLKENETVNIVSTKGAAHQ